MKKIVVVDDDADILYSVKKTLGDYYKILDVSSGKECLELMKTESVDLFIVDLMMPEMDGWELCHEIRKISDIPIIIMSADTRQLSKNLAEKVYHAISYLEKPVTEQELLDKIGEVF